MTSLISFLTSEEKNITIVGNFNLEVAAASEQRKLCSLHVISECFPVQSETGKITSGSVHNIKRGSVN